MASGTADASTPSPQERFDALQQRSRWLAFPIAVQKKFSDDQASNQAALLSYYGFFSIFPLMLVFTTILGFVLKHDAHLRQSITTSVVAKLPIIGTELQGKSLTGSVAGLVIGVVTSLWSGLAITTAAQNALDKVWAVPMKARRNFVHTRLLGVMLLFSLGLLFAISAGATGVVSGGLGGVGARIGGYVVSLIINFCLFYASYRLLTAKSIKCDLRIGSAVAAVLWTILGALQGIYIDHLKHSSNAYGTFGLVIALLIWLHLGAQIFLYCAEINVVHSRRLWPRSFFGDPVQPADQEALRSLAEIEERSDAERVAVRFSDGADGDGRSAGAGVAASQPSGGESERASR
ncbi:MAG TPA: YihY/virulence factor BrkB family protein [Solirubrobacteraceae bacterium]|nr:YihY/virulence factor BrkB family protein [Solirubrobacteraceae bacterium]